MDIRVVIHHIGEGEEMFGVNEDFIGIGLQGVVSSKAFFAAGIHSGGSHNYLDYRIQSMRAIGNSSGTRYRPHCN